MTYPSASRHKAGLQSPRHAQLVETTMIWGGTSTGSANAQVISPEFSADMKGHPTYVWVAGYSNTGAMTLSADGGATNTSLRKADGAAMVGGEIVAGTAYQVVFDGTYWRLIGGAGAGSSYTGTSSKAVNYTLSAGDGGGVIKCTASLTITLLAASGLSGAWWVTLSNRSAGTITITPSGADTVGGASSWTIRAWQDLTIYRTSSSTFEVLNLGASVVDAIATWSPTNKGSGVTLSNNNLTAACAVNNSVRATIGQSSGKRYFEVAFASVGSAGCGVQTASGGLASIVGQDANGWAYLSDGRKYTSGAGSAYGSTYASGSTVRIAHDIDTGKIWVAIGSTWQGGGDPVAGTNPMFTGVTGSTYYPAIGDYSSSSTGTGAFLASSFAYAPPTGYTSYY